MSDPEASEAPSILDRVTQALFGDEEESAVEEVTPDVIHVEARPEVTEEEKAERDFYAKFRKGKEPTQLEQDTLDHLTTLEDEEQLAEKERQTAVWVRRARAQQRWLEEIEPIGEKLGIAIEDFGAPQAPKGGVQKVLDAARENPGDPELAHALLYFGNELGLLTQGTLTAKNYAEKLPNIRLKEENDTIRVNVERAQGGELVVAGAPQAGTVVFVDVPGFSESDAQYESYLRNIAHAAYGAVGTADFKKFARNYAYMVQEPELVLRYANGDKDVALRAIKHGQMAQAASRKAGGSVPPSYVPMQDKYGTSLDWNTMKLVAYMSEHRRLREETGKEPDPATVVASLDKTLVALEQKIRNRGVPIFNADPSEVVQGLLRFSRDATDFADAHAARLSTPLLTFVDKLESLGDITDAYNPYMPEYVTKQRRATANRTRELATLYGQVFGGLPTKAATAMIQQYVPAEFKSGYITVNGEELRVAEDRFVESLVGRGTFSSTADYVLAASAGEASAKPYVLMLDKLKKAHPEEPLDGLVMRHPLEAWNSFYEYTGSEEAVLDKAVTESQLAEMLVTFGRVMSPTHEFITAGGLLSDPEDDTSPGGPFRRLALKGLQGQQMLGGMAGILLAMTRDPTDAINLLIGPGAKTVGKAFKSAPVQRRLTASRAATEAMERSVLDGIPQAALALRDDLIAPELFDFVTEGMRTQDILAEAVRRDQALMAAGEEPIVLRRLLTEAGRDEYQVAQGLEAVLTQINTEVQALSGLRASDVAPVYELAGAASRQQQAVATRAGGLVEKITAALEDVKFDLTRRRAYDGALTDYVETVMFLGTLRRARTVIDKRIAALTNLEVSTKRVQGFIASVVKNPEAAKARLLEVLGPALKAPLDLGKDAHRLLGVYFSNHPQFEGLPLFDILRRLRSGGKGDKILADTIVDKFLGAYTQGKLTTKAVTTTASQRLRDEIRILKGRSATLARREQTIAADAAANRQVLDEATDAILELSPRQTQKAEARAAREGKQGPEIIRDADGNIVKGKRPPPAPRVKDDGTTVDVKSLREKLKGYHDDLAKGAESPRKREQERATKRGTKVAKKRRATGKKSLEKLEETAEVREQEKVLQESLRDSAEAAARKTQQEIGERLIAMTDTLETTRTMRTAADETYSDATGFVAVEKILDDFSRGRYPGRTLAEVISQVSDPRVADKFATLWANGDRAHAALFSAEAADLTDIHRVLEANYYWFDPAAAAGRQKQPFEEAVASFFDLDGRGLFLSMADFARVYVDKYGQARLLRQLQNFLGTMAPTTVPRALLRMRDEGQRRDNLVAADVDAIESAVGIATAREGVAPEDVVELNIKARVAYVTRDWETLATDPELGKIFTVTEESARTKGITEQAVGGPHEMFFSVFLGNTARPLRLLNSSTSLISDVTEHLAAVRGIWAKRLDQFQTYADDEVGAVVITLVKSQMRDSSTEEGVRQAVQQFMEDLAGLKETDVLFTGTGRQRYDALKELLQGRSVPGPLPPVKGSVAKAKVGADQTQRVTRLRDEANMLKVLTRSAGYIRGLNVLALASVGVTAADARQATITLSRGAMDMKAGMKGLTEQLFNLRAFQEGPIGTHVYVYDELIEAQKHIGEYLPTDVGRRDRETKELVGRKARLRSTTAPAEKIIVTKDYGKGRDKVVVDPRISHAPRYTVVKEMDEDGYVRIQDVRTGAERLILRTELRTVPAPLNAAHMLDSLSRLGRGTPMYGEELSAGLQRLMLLITDPDTPRYLIRAQLDDLGATVRTAEKTFKDVLQSSTKPVFSAEALQAFATRAVTHAANMVGAFILYGFAAFRKSGKSGRAVKVISEDSMSGTQVRGLRTGASLQIAGLRALSKAVLDGRMFTPIAGTAAAMRRAGKVLAPRVQEIVKHNEVLSRLSTSMSSAMAKLPQFLPNDIELLFDGPLEYIERAKPSDVFDYNGMRVLGEDGAPMTVGETFDELVGAGAFDTFHSQARDALMFSAMSAARTGRGRRDRYRSTTDAPAGTPRRFMQEGSMSDAEIDYAFRATAAYADQLSQLVDDLGTEQRVWLYLDARSRGATRDKAHKILNMTLLNWTEPSLVTKRLIPSLVLFLRAKEQSYKQAMRVWTEAIGGNDPKALRSFMAYLRFKERVLPYLAETATRGDPPEDPEEQARYFRALDVLRELRQDWQEPYVQVTVHPYSEKERRQLQQMAPDLPLYGESIDIALRANYEETMVPFKIGDALVALIASATYTAGLQDTYQSGLTPTEALQSLVPSLIDEINPVYKLFVGEEDRRKKARYARPGEHAFALLAETITGGYGVQTEGGDPIDEASAKQEALRVAPGALPTGPLGPIAYAQAFQAYQQAELLDHYQAMLRGAPLEEASLMAPVIASLDEDAAAAYRASPNRYIPQQIAEGKGGQIHEKALAYMRTHMRVALETSGVVRTDHVQEASAYFNLEKPSAEIMAEAIKAIQGGSEFRARLREKRAAATESLEDSEEE